MRRARALYHGWCEISEDSCHPWKCPTNTGVSRVALIRRVPSSPSARLASPNRPFLIDAAAFPDKAFPALVGEPSEYELVCGAYETQILDLT